MEAPVITISSDITKESVGSSEPADELPERHVSLRLYDDVVSRWRDMVRFRPSPSGSSSPDTTILSAEIPVAPTPPAPSTEITTASPACDTSTAVITASSAVRSHIRTTARKSTLGLRPVMTPTRSVALCRARQAALSIETSSSDTSSESSSDSASHTSKSSFTASLQGTQISPEDYLHHSSKAIRSPSGPLTCRRPQCLDYTTPTSSSSTGPSRKRSRSLATSISFAVHTVGALSPTRVDLLPPHKRYRGTSAMHSDESGDEGSPETHTESDMDSDIRADIKAESQRLWLLLRQLMEAGDETDAEIQPKGTIEIGVDVAIGIDIPDNLLMPDAIERLGQLEEGMRERVMALEGSNTRLRDTLGIERVRADSLQRRLGYVEDELKQNGDDNDNGSGGNGNHGNNNGDGNQNGGNGGARRNVPVARTIGIDEAYEMSWKDLMKLIIDVYCPRNEIQKLENELWNLCVKGTDVAGYTRRFQELVLLCPRMVPEENDKIERFIWGLPDNIQGNVTSSKPVRLQDAVRMANGLMDQKVCAYAARSAEQKRNFENNPRGNRVHQLPFKRQNVAQAVTVGNNEKRGYAGSAPYCNKCRLHHEGPCTVSVPTARGLATWLGTGHYKSDCPKLKNQNRGNKAANNDAHGRAYALGGGYGNPDSNVVTGKLNPRYIGPFKILAKVGTVAYCLELPEQLSRVHSTFHDLNLKKCLSDETFVIPLDETQIDDKLHFVKEPVEIMDREVKRLKQSRIPIVKLRWNSRRGPKFIWEREDQFRKKYPHLFAKSSTALELLCALHQMNLVHGRNHLITSKTINISTIKSHSKKLHKTFSSSSSTHQLNTAHKILNSKTATEALQIHQTSTSTPSLNPTKTLILHSATIHFLTNQRLYLKARCLIKCLIESLSKTCTPNRVSSLLYNSLNNPEFVKPETKVFGVLVIALCEFGFVDEAYWVVKKSGNLPALHVCNRVLDGFLKMGNVEKMWEVYGCFTARGMVSGVVTYGILVDGCCRGGDVEKGLKVFDEMLERGLRPSVVVYTSLIRGFCGEGRMLEAESVFGEMRKVGVSPDLYTYNALLDGYCKMANVGKALDFYREMLDVGLIPNFVTFGMLIDLFRKVGGTLAAQSCFANMMKFGEVPNSYMYNSLIDGYCKEGNLSAACDLLSEMETFGIANDVFTYCILINGHCNMGRLEDAYSLLEEMKRKGVVANSAVYNALINGYVKNGNMVKALEVCGEMVGDGVELNIITYSTLIDGYCKTKNMEGAMGLYTEMVIRGLVPDVVTYTALIDGHFKDCNTKVAFRLYNEMIEAGLSPNVFTLSCVIDGICKDGLTNDAIKIFLNSDQFCSPNIVLYTSLIYGLCNDGQIFKASKFFSDMRSIGLKADVELYAVVTQCHFKAKHMLDVLMLHADMLKLGLIPNEVIYGVFARGYREIGDYKSAFRCSDDLLHSGLEVLGSRLESSVNQGVLTEYASKQEIKSGTGVVAQCMSRNHVRNSEELSIEMATKFPKLADSEMTQRKKNLSHEPHQTEPKNIKEAIQDESWTMAMQEELNQFKTNDIWCLVPPPKNQTVIGTKWVFKNKLDKNGVVSRNKARLVAQGYNQQEDIDLDETYAPVARLESIRIPLAYACAHDFKLFQMDVKSAFLNGFINEEVYVAQPPGFVDFEKPNHVFKLKKALYGLKQAPKAWYDRLKAFLLDHKYTLGLFEMSMMGELNFFLGLQIKQLEDGIFFNQSKYVKEMLKKFGLKDAKPIKTPMSSKTKLTRDEEGEPINDTKYHGMIGSLLYLTASRPDIMFSVSLCARFQEAPKISHLEAVKRIFRYIKGTSHLGLWYPKGTSLETIIYADSHHVRDYVDRKSTSGVCTFIGCCLTSWMSKKQTALPISTTKAEYVSPGKACQQALWMKQALVDYEVKLNDNRLKQKSRSS
ncbi:pentatricopeptide repeat-containing protein [Tanacetum coccineum]